MVASLSFLGRFAQNLSKSYFKISQLLSLLSFVVICCRLLFNNKDNINNIDNFGLSPLKDFVSDFFIILSFSDPFYEIITKITEHTNRFSFFSSFRAFSELPSS